ncbi:hypothetical protein JAAARDRAFT_38696 [Jaapia argillacea MUCL 33604]|uniref:Histidinol-phosphatase n=1 Tax=Jaapia argillacea MUCL 33604 TaxID=933084 RepID=A0A067PH18_9AGAM|nr:hypothetical protein JAAARDRAFT_38696 [Jaapia argillacea MUCL 33604]
MPYSHHSHSGQFCKHALGTLEDVVLEAIKQGFEVYGLTEHVPRYRDVDFYPEEKDLHVSTLVEQFDAFIAEAHRLKACYASQITLLVGLETEYITELDLKMLDDLLERYGEKVEFMVGSVHHVDSTPIDFDQATFQKCLESFPSKSHSNADNPEAQTHEQMNTLLCTYFDSQYTVLARFHPEVIGHIDLCRLYNPSLRFSDYPEVWEKLERNIITGVEYGALFELNAAALRKGWEGSYPGEDVIKLIQKHGGRFALSDDSHGPHAVGLNYDRMASYLRKVGIDEVWYLKRTDSGPVNAAARRMAAVKVDGNWWEHHFWKGRQSTVA